MLTGHNLPRLTFKHLKKAHDSCKHLLVMAEFPIHRLQHNEGPPGIWSFEEPPECFFIQGKPEALALLELLPERGLAVVGTREPQPRCLNLVRATIGGLSGSRLVIISGLARGIDTRAHEAALDAGLPTIAILGGGLDIPYPRENIDLRHRILETGGLIVSEFPAGTEPRPGNFLRRNRIIAGWSQATWVVEAAFQSGALNTASWTRGQHRTVFATPCFPGDPALAGNQILLDRDAAVAFFGTHCLGQVWIELAARGRSKTKLQLISGATTSSAPDKSGQLANQVCSQTAQSGGAEVQALLDWAIQSGWTPQEFFVALQQALERSLISDHEGVLVGPLQ
jgi:DNA processing protein